MAGNTPKFFSTAAAFRTWLERHHADRTELWVGYYKKPSGRGGMVYREALDQALCYGWIDGVVNPIDGHRYKQRFTPRTAKSRWSQVNLRRFEVLRAQGVVTPAGRRARDRWDGQAAPYAHQQRDTALSAAFVARFKKRAAAWRRFGASPPGYQRVATFWVMSAKRDETRMRRLEALIAACAGGKRIGPLRNPGEQRRRGGS